MLVTSAEANKKLRQLKEEKDNVETAARKASVFSAAVGEDIESLRPVFDYDEYINKCRSIETEIRSLKHKINAFNVETEVPGFDMTIDQMLVYIPFLTSVKQEAYQMMSRLPKERKDSRYNSSPIIDYVIANYPIEKAAATFEWASEELSRAQLALDTVNTTVRFEI